MKTPRDILLKRHQAVEPKLNAIRREVVAVAADVNRRKQPIREFTFAATLADAFRLLFRELVWPCRRIWTGLAAVWLLILTVNFSMCDTVSSVTGQPVRSPVVVISWQTQQHWMSQLLTEHTVPPELDRPRKAVPGPRTENFAPAAV